MTNEDLKKMQALPLSRKILITQARIIEFYNRLSGKVYISFSGGKDSTVLLDIARKIFADIEAVFVDTGLEYPEIKDFVKSQKNITIIRPKMTFRQVIEKYGYPVISKEIANTVDGARKGQISRLKKLNGEMKFVDGGRSTFNCEKWRFLLDAPFKISDRCCNELKKKPAAKFNKISGKYPIVGMLAVESRKRKIGWLKTGCNIYEKDKIQSNPLSFWTEQDILLYLQKYKIPYASIYGDIICEDGKLKTTGVNRTGCIYCLFGAHLEKTPNRFEQLKTSHPGIYEYCINDLGLKTVLDFLKINY